LQEEVAYEHGVDAGGVEAADGVGRRRVAELLFIRMLIGIRLNDTTNAFKAYRRKVIEGCKPILSPHFNLTVELPLKTIVRGYTWTIVPITWRNRRTGTAKLKLKEMGSRYLFICLYVWLEKYFSRGDYSAVHK
jgi:dolichol-phosphate mannosyltransferase